MWTPCPRNLDEPVLVLGLELEDLAAIMSTLILASTLLAFFPSIAVAGLAGYGLWRGKRGQPPGTLIHACHRLELLPIPGVLRPRAPRYSPW